MAHRDRGLFRFAPLQSELGAQWVGNLTQKANRYDTLILVEDGKSYGFSTGALRIARKLKWPWPLLFGFIVVPRPLRDAVYKLVSRYRFKWFGRAEACQLDGSNVAARLLVDETENDAS